FIALFEPPYPFEQRAVANHRIGERAAAHARSRLDLLDGLRLQPVTVLAKHRAVHRPGSPPPDGKKDLVCVAQIGACVLHSGSEIVEYAALPLEHLAHAGIERELAQIQTPGDPDAVEIAIQ